PPYVLFFSHENPDYGNILMFMNIDEPSMNIFPWNIDKQSNPISVKQSFTGKRYFRWLLFQISSTKHGSLFLLENGLLVFVWDESREVLTLQRLDFGNALFFL
ncbi:hypothetical protein MIMGU_mgv1a0222591mg, partial [Erythranthe guttata]